MKVLVIDDEALIRKSLIRAFKAKGHEVFEAPDGLEGVRLWREHKPDLIFLDVLMPGLTGPQVLREMGPERSGKVVLISAYTGEYNLEAAQQIGADLFVAKPFDDIFSLVRQGELLTHAPS